MWGTLILSSVFSTRSRWSKKKNWFKSKLNSWRNQAKDMLSIVYSSYVNLQFFFFDKSCKLQLLKTAKYIIFQIKILKRIRISSRGD